MSDYYKCSWCGRSYEKSGASKFLGGATMGISNLGKKYCSKSCDYAANKATNGPKSQSNNETHFPTGANHSGGGTTVVNKGPGFGSFMGKAFGDTISSGLNSMERNSNDLKEKEANKQNKIEDLAQMVMSNDTDELQIQLNYLASLASSKPEKDVKNVIIEKMEFGIMKLRSGGSTNEADFFQNKLEPLKKKGWF